MSSTGWGRPPGIARIGIGGPVGSGKTALIEALVPLLIDAGHCPLVVTNDMFTSEDAKRVRQTLVGVLAPERAVGVETGSCPHTAVRDPSMNLAAVTELTQRFFDADVVLVKSGGDNPCPRSFSPSAGASGTAGGGGPRARRGCSI